MISTLTPYIIYEVLSENIPAGTSFLTVISRRTQRNHIFWGLVARKKVPSRKTRNKIGSPG
jgi:hypothetical protein